MEPIGYIILSLTILSPLFLGNSAAEIKNFLTGSKLSITGTINFHKITNKTVSSNPNPIILEDR